MIIKRRLAEGEALPFGYGIAGHNFEKNEWEIYPIPINLVMGGLRRLWFKILSSHTKTEETKVYKIGYDRGFTDGRRFYHNYEFQRLIEED